MKTKTPVWDITLARESLEMTLRDNDVELSSFLMERVGLRKSQITAENSFEVLTKIQGIKNSNREYVVIPSPEHRGDGNTSHQARNLASEIAAINQNLQKIRDLIPNYFYINNEAGNHEAGHWDLYGNQSSQKIEASVRDLACGCYTILQILKAAPAIAPKLDKVLEKLSTEEANKITELLAQDSKVINEFQETALLRKFVRAAMLNSDPASGTEVLASKYQIEMEELEKALDGLGIQYLMTFDIKKVAEPLSAQEIKEYEEVIIERFTRNDEVKRDTMENLSNYLKTTGKSEYDISSILTQIRSIKFVQIQQDADIDNSTADPSANLFQSPQKGVLAKPSSSKLAGVFELNAALDDSSDEESSSKADTFNSATNWQSFKKEKKSFIDGLTTQSLSEEDIKNSFLLHAAGIKAIYGSTADSHYRTKKQSSFNQVDLAPQITAAVDLSVKKIVKSVCTVCYKFDQLGDQEEKITEEIGNAVLVKSQAEIEEFSKLLRNNRVIGRRLWALDSVTTPENIKKLSEEVSKNFFDVIAEKKLSFKAPINISHWHYRFDQEYLGKAACNAAKVGLQGLNYNGIALLSQNGYSPDAKSKKKIPNLTFNNFELAATLEAAWDLTKVTEARSPVNFSLNIQEITKAYLQDLVNLDQKDKTKSHSSKVWEKALEHEDIIKLLPLTPQRAESKVLMDFKIKLKPLLQQHLSEIRFVRPTLPEMHELTSSSIAEFLANLHLANKSQTRAIRNFEDERNNNGEIFYRSWKLSDSAQSKPALERQEITTNRVRTDFVDNAGTNTSNYDTIYRDLQQLQRRLNVTDATIGGWIKKIIDGTPIEALQNNQNQPVNFSNTDKKILINTVYLILGTETARNPASLTANMMLMDLVENSYYRSEAERATLQKAFSKNGFEGRYGGGEAPMSIGKMMVISTSQKGSSGKKLSSKDSQDGEEKKELGEPVQSARRLHQEFASFMPFAYKYEGDAHGDGDKDAKRTAELVRRESEVVKRWIAQKDISSDFFEESMLIAYQDWHITDFKKDKGQNIAQSALNKWLAGMGSKPAKEFKMGDYTILTNLLERFEFKPDQDQYDEIGDTVHKRLNHLKAKDCPPAYAEKIFIKTLAKQKMFDLELLDSKKDVGSKGSNTGKYGSLVTWIIESTIDQEDIGEVFVKEAVMVGWKEWTGFDPLPYPNNSKEHPTLLALEKWLLKIEENEEEMNQYGIGEENYELLAKVIELCPYTPRKEMSEKLSTAIYSRLRNADSKSIDEQEERLYRNLAKAKMFNLQYEDCNEEGIVEGNLITHFILQQLNSVVEVMIPEIPTEFLSTELEDGFTAMSIAAANNDEKICKLLVNHQIPVDEKTKESDFYEDNKEIFHPKKIEKQKLSTPSNSSSPLSHSQLSSKSIVNSQDKGIQ